MFFTIPELFLNKMTLLAANNVKVYADIFSIINVSMDFLLFFIVAVFLRLGKNPRRFFVSALISGLFPILQLYLSGNESVDFILRAIVVFVSCKVAFTELSFIKLSYVFALFFSLSNIFSALLTHVYTRLGEPTFLPEKAEGSGGVIPLVICCVGAFVSWIFSALGKKEKKRKKARKKSLKSRLTVISDGKEVEMSAYCDSGNLLKEPIGHLPVIITGRTKMEKVVPLSLHSVFFSSGEVSEPSLADARRVRIIPIMPVGSIGARILFGYVPDKILIDGEEVTACIAFDPTGERFGDCDALLPGEFAI